MGLFCSLISFRNTVSYSSMEFSSNILIFAENGQFHQNLLPILFHRMVGPHKIVVVSPMKWITGRVCHVNIKPLTVKTLTYPQRIGTPLVILLNRMAGPLKLCESQSQIFITLTLYLWQLSLRDHREWSFLYPQWSSPTDNFLKILLGIANVTFMITSDNFL